VAARRVAGSRMANRRRRHVEKVMASNDAQQIVQQLWNDCNVLR
jgi:hypothetical protein